MDFNDVVGYTADIQGAGAYYQHICQGQEPPLLEGIPSIRYVNNTCSFVRHSTH